VEPVLASPTDTSSQIAPLQWDGVPGAAWSDVHQEASHNSYAVPGGIDALVEVGVRTFELDIHRQPPATQIRSDDADIADWHVYHILGWSHREYLTLSHGLAALAAAEVAEPVTVFIDNKDGFGGTHTADAFDQLVRQALGHRLFTPGDLMLRAPGAETLLDAVQRAGWPTVAELEGRVLVVLTDDLGGYHGIGRSAFIAPPPEFSNVQGQVLHQADDNAVFYNANTRQIGIDEVQAMNVTDTVLRTYFNPRCSERFFGEAPVEVNYRAVDTALDGPTCGTQVRVRPVRVPEPG